MRKTFVVLLVAVLAVGLVWFGCGKEPTSVTAPTTESEPAAKLSGIPPGIERAMAVQDQHTDRLMGIRGVVGTATGFGPEGKPAVLVLAKAPGIAGIPRSLDGVPVIVKVTGEIRALQGVDPTSRFPRPVPIGVSTGNEGECSSGTIGCRVKDADGNVYALSNNHVYALENKARKSSKVLQPGRYDTGCNIDPNDVIGTLAAFERIKFTFVANNKIDAAIANSSTELLGNATPSDGYGTPKSDIVPAALGQAVQKYGRTTSLTTGTITGINATVNVGYSSGTARFVDQIIVESAPGFILPGDSGSLLVTDPDCNPVGLLFAGDETGAFAVGNRIDLVLARFDVTIDGPETPLTDVAVTGVSAPGSVVQGDVVSVDVTVENVGNQDVTTDINVTLTDGVTIIGAKPITGGLTAGASTTLTFSWNTGEASLGDHTLTASHGFADDNSSNDSNSTTVTVSEVGTTPVVDACTPNEGNPGDRPTVVVTGSNFQDGATVDFGERIIVQEVTFVSPSQLDVRIRIHPRAASGSRDVTVTNPDGQSGTETGGFTVN